MALSNEPGVVRWTKIIEVSPGTSGGQASASGILMGQSNIGSSGEVLVVLDWPDGLSRDDVSVGSIGAATVINEDSGAIGSLASILLKVKAFMQYL